jgi:hypothetical protein
LGPAALALILDVLEYFGQGKSNILLQEHREPKLAEAAELAEQLGIGE